jgi:hypothetical protein
LSDNIGPILEEAAAFNQPGQGISKSTETLQLTYSKKFAARAAHYHTLALAEADEWRVQSLFEVSSLFLEMAERTTDRERSKSRISTAVRLEACHRSRPSNALLDKLLDLAFFLRAMV